MPPHNGGVERVADLISRAYARAGDEVTWIATAPPSPPGSVTADDGRRLVRIPATNVLESWFGMPYPIPAPAHLSDVARAVRRSDLVHVHDCLYVTSVAAVAAAGRRPVLVTQHVGRVSFGPLVDPIEALAYRAIGRWIARRAALIAFASEGVREWWMRAVSRHGRTVLVPNSVDVARFRPVEPSERSAARRELGIPTDVPVALFVGRLVRRKHVGVAVAALRRAPPWHLLVVGDGPDAADVADPSGVTHLRSLAHERMPLAYRASDAFVLPSVGEGAPLALLEALASGLPSILSTDPAFAAAASGGAVQVPVDATAIAAALRALAEPAVRSARGAAARRWALAGASDEAFAARYVAITRELLEQGRSA